MKQTQLHSFFKKKEDGGTLTKDNSVSKGSDDSKENNTMKGASTTPTAKKSSTPVSGRKVLQKVMAGIGNKRRRPSEDVVEKYVSAVFSVRRSHIDR